VSVRVTSWIVLLAAAETIHEITLNNTNDGPLHLISGSFQSVYFQLSNPLLITRSRD